MSTAGRGMFSGRGGACVALLLCSTALAALPARPAWAQVQTVSYSIPSGNLAPALTRWARASGVKLLASSEALRGRQTRGVSGSLAPQAALSALLAGTGLTYSLTGGTATIVDTSQGASAGTVDGDVVQLEAIEVTNGQGSTVARVEEPYTQAGSKSYISADQIFRVPPSSAGDVFKNTPGVIAAGNRNGASIDLNIRGLQGMNRVATLVDGTHQSNSLYTGYRGISDRVYMDQDLIGGVSVEKGPSSGEHGAGAIGGVVNIRTLEAGDIVEDGKSHGVRIKTGLGSNTTDVDVRRITAANIDSELKDDRPFFNDQSWSGSVAGGFVQEDFELVAAFARRKSGNYFSGKNGSTKFTREWRNGLDDLLTREDILSVYGPGKEVPNTSQDAASGLIKGKLSFGDGHSLALGYTYYENDYGEASDTALLVGDYSQRNLSTVRTDTYTARYAWAPSDNPLIDFHANIWASKADNDSPNILNAPVFFPDAPPPPVDTSSEVFTVGGEIWNTSRIDAAFSGLTLKYGAQHYVEDVESQSSYGFGFGLNDMNGTREVGGLFVDADLAVTDWLTLGASARFDTYSAEDARPVSGPDVDDEGFSPAARIVLEPWDGIQFYGLYAQGWRPPSLRELFYLEPAGQTNDLEPERAENYEFGINVARHGVATENDRLLFKFSYFDNLTKDYIARMGGNMVSYNFYNVESVHYKGVEVSTNYDSGRYFGEASLTYYTFAEYCMPAFDPGPDVCDSFVKGPDYGAPYIPPKWAGSVTLGTRLLDETLTLGTKFNFAGERLTEARRNFRDDTQWTQYFILDLFGSYKVNETLSVNVSAENVFDRYYLDALSRAQMPSPGRTVRASLTAKF